MATKKKKKQNLFKISQSKVSSYFKKHFKSVWSLGSTSRSLLLFISKLSSIFGMVVAVIQLFLYLHMVRYVSPMSQLRMGSSSTQPTLPPGLINSSTIYSAINLARFCIYFLGGIIISLFVWHTLSLCVTEICSYKSSNKHLMQKRLGLVASLTTVVVYLVTLVAVVILLPLGYFAHDTAIINGLNASMNFYNKYLPSREFINVVQVRFQCCGVDGYKDWFTGAKEKEEYEFLTEDLGYDNVPWSCCNQTLRYPCRVHQIEYQMQEHKSEPTIPVLINTEGCSEAVKNKIFLWGCIIFSASIVQLFVMVATGILIRLATTSNWWAEEHAIKGTKLFIFDTSHPTPTWLAKEPTGKPLMAWYKWYRENYKPQPQRQQRKNDMELGLNAIITHVQTRKRIGLLG